ncbi:hypothetical protein [Streptomyces sp. NRRL F-5630]|uniref:hypothetical protein n=1 Tax=Streptomyces sp. NRRL F-5630 TaxID=1463864 RepID=UPI003EB6E239
MSPEPPPHATIARCSVHTWLTQLLGGHEVAYLCISHPAPRFPGETTASIESDLRALAGAMGMRPAADRITSLGPRLLLSPGVLALDYGRPGWWLRTRAPHREWRHHLMRGAEICVLVTLDPVRLDIPLPDLEHLLTESIKSGRVFMGATTYRTSA